MVVEAPTLAELHIVSVFARKSEVCPKEFYVAMHIKTPFDNALYLSSLSCKLRLFFGGISKTNKT